MFNEKYKKDNEQIFADDALISKTKSKMVSAGGCCTPQKKRTALNSAVSLAATAAIVCFCVFGNILPINNVVEAPGETPSAGNLFTLTAYAMEREEDGTVAPRKLDFTQGDNAQHKIYISMKEGSEEAPYDVSFYMPLGFKCEGENISKVTFAVNKGGFTEIGSGSPVSLSKTYTIDYSDTEKNIDMLHWGMNIENMLPTSRGSNRDTWDIPDEINIKAVVTFIDGQQQEKEILYDLQKGSLVLSEK